MSTSKPINELSDAQLRKELNSYGFKAGPISATTRSVLEKKLSKLRSNTSMSSNFNTSATSKGQSPSTKSVASPVPKQSSKTTAGDSTEHQSDEEDDSTETSRTLSPPTKSVTSPVPQQSNMQSKSHKPVSNTEVLPPTTSIAKVQPPIKGVTSHVPQQLSKTAAGDSNEHQSNVPLKFYKPILHAEALPPTVHARDLFSEQEMNLRSTLKKNVQQVSTMRSGLPTTRQNVSNRLPILFDEEDDSVVTSHILPSTSIGNSFNDREMDLVSTPKENDQQAPQTRSDLLFARQNASNRPPILFEHQSYETDEENDSVETSRVLSPSERLNVKHSSPSVLTRVLQNVRPSMLRMQQNLRPLMLRVRQLFMSTQAIAVLKWVVPIFGSIVALILLGYVLAAYRESISHAGRLASETIIGTLYAVYSYAILPAIVLILIGAVTFGIYFLYKKYKNARETQKRRIMNLVDRIAERVQAAGTGGVFELRLRDTLFPPTRRTAEELQIWSDAIKFINDTDYRIRSESRLVNGVESNFLIWADTSHERQGQIKPSSSANSSRATSSRAPLSYASGIPVKTPSCCLKVTGMVDERIEYDDAVHNEIHGLLHPIQPIHFATSHLPGDFAVYMMFSNPEEAKVAFENLHGHWYQGHLVSVKYVTKERYAEKFPEVAGK